MKLLVDMNISPDFCRAIAASNVTATHWSEIGKHNESDVALMKYARDHGYVVVSHDLDFSAILAASGAHGPSVIQVRTQDVLVPRFVEILLTAIGQFHTELDTGAIVMVDADRAKVRVLPIG